VVRVVREDVCEVWSRTRGIRSVAFAATFPLPRSQRVSPGHLVAIASGPSSEEVVLWRWYDCVVLSHHGDEVRLWEPGHGEVLARRRSSYAQLDPGARAYASAGLPGAEWWVATRADTDPEAADVELDDVAKLYTDHHLWSAVFSSRD
jgi:hypothetical protein